VEEGKMVCLSCGSCGEPISHSHKFCHKCGKRAGIGIREPGELFAEVASLEKITFPCTPCVSPSAVLNEIRMAIRTLNWVLGKTDITPTKSIHRGIAGANRFGASNG
jgi:hypothetical protein